VDSVGSLIGFDDADSTRDVPCRRCRRMVPCPEMILELIRDWNKREMSLCDERGRMPALITDGEIWFCHGCMLIERANRHAENARELEITGICYRDLVVNNIYTADSLAWLRSHGCAEKVAEVLGRKEATT